MKLSGSRIPHLARALAEKRKPQLGNSVVHCRLLSQRPPAIPKPIRPTVPAALPSTTSSKAARRVPRVSESQDVPSPIPRRSRREHYDEEGFDESGRYNPSKDPKRVKTFLIITSIFATVVGTYIFYAVTTYRNELKKYNESEDKLVQDADVSDRWYNEKRNFDYEVDGQEKISWMKGKRRRLIREAFGDVLEVSVGTGRNMDLYDTRPFSEFENSSFGRSTRHFLTSLTFNDQSPVMIERAQKKWEDDQKARLPGDRFIGEAKFITGDARVPGVIPRPPGGYDTIVQSMGICSMSEPVKFLRLLGRLVRQPGEPVINAAAEKIRNEESADGKGGRIFLLEHGRAYEWLGWLNRYLDNSAAMHANRYGCWYNKDIEKIVRESGLEVERVKRHYFGTVLEIVLRPAMGPLPGEEIPKKEQNVVSEHVNNTSSSGWWSGFWK